MFDNKNTSSGLVQTTFILGSIWGVCFFLLFVIYKLGHEENLPTSLWNVLESDVIKILTTGVVLPIALLLIENRLKLLKAYRDRVDAAMHREHEAQEKLRSDTLRRSTSEVQQFFRELDRVAHYDPERESAHQLLLDIFRLGDVPPNLRTALTTAFPTTLHAERDTAAIVYLLNVVYLCNYTVCELIWEKRIPAEEIAHHRDLIYVINEAFWNFARFFLEHTLLPISDFDVANGEAPESDDKWKGIEWNRKDLEGIVRSVLWIEWLHNDDFPRLEMPEIEQFRARRQAIDKWVAEWLITHRTAEGRAAQEKPQFDMEGHVIPLELLEACSAAFKKVPMSARLTEARMYYSSAFLDHLAEYANESVRATRHGDICRKVVKGDSEDLTEESLNLLWSTVR